MRSYHDSAFDGLFQAHGRWGHVEAPLEFKDEIISVVNALCNQPAAEDGDPAQSLKIGDEDDGTKCDKVVDAPNEQPMEPPQSPS